MKERFLVVGLGRFGTALARTLARERKEVVAVDTNMANVEHVQRELAYVAQLDATDPEALRSMEAATCATAIVSMGEHFEASALCVAALKDIGVPRILARARTPAQRKILLAAGASEVIEVEEEMGKRLGQQLAAGEKGPAAGGRG
jgi:trk system potassium uptake protein TrkA